MTMSPEPQNKLSQTIFAGESEMAALMRSYDWSQSSLGPIETWSQSLKAGIRIILGSRYPMFIWWGQDLINFYNDAYIPVLGKRHPQALGESARDIWSELWHSVGPLAEEVLNHGNPSWNEEFLELMERNGYREETYLTFSYSPIGTDDGSIGGIFCACTEDTRRVVDERRLQTLRELGAETTHAKTVDEACQISAAVFANNLKDIPFALIYLFDPDRQQARLVSTTNLAIGTSASPEMIQLADPSSDCWSLRSILTTGKNQVMEQLTDRFGPLPGGAWDEPATSAIVLPLMRPGQKILGALIIGISPYRPLDDQYRGFFDLVSGQVTMAMVNILAFEEERKRAEALAELDRVKTIFFNNVSHEFRTPITLLLGPLEDALTSLEAVEAGSSASNSNDAPQNLALNLQNPFHRSILKEQLRLAQRNGLRLLKLVNTLLDFSQIESDRIQAVYEPTDLASFTTELASVFRSAIERANLRFTVNCLPLSEPIYVDREMWEKIVLNLLSNAFKFTFSGGITVQLQPVGNQVELAVKDTGIGIPAAEIPHLFQRFHQVKGAEGRSVEGSGIGLSLVQELVKLHQGTIQISSIEGSGSCFRVFIPMGSAHLPQEKIRATPTLTSTITGAMPYLEETLRWLPEEDLRLSILDFERSPDAETGENSAPQPQDLKSKIQNPKSKILLVDDNADMRDYLRRLLSQHWQVETAANGAIALQSIQQAPPDLVLSDIMMPELNGLQLLQRLRADPQTSGIPIILLSARAGEAATIEGLTAGANDYLIKPFSARELIARVRTQLQMAQLQQAQAANQFKDEFLKTITHELQAPLVTILGWARLLQSKTFDTVTIAKALASIERNATIQAKLVRDLLDVSGILSGSLQLKPQLVDLAALVQTATENLREAATAKAIHLEKTIINLPKSTILADGDRLQQVITNLLENAIKFTPERGQVNIRLEWFDSEIRIIVRDTGIGIHPDFLPLVFDRFSQEEVPSRHSPGGVGIGLAIARHLVELHHGTIEATSEGEGQGATFTVTLPLLTSKQLNITNQAVER